MFVVGKEAGSLAALVAAVVFGTGCAHLPTLAERAARPEVAIEVDGCPGPVRLHSPALEYYAERSRPGLCEAFQPNSGIGAAGLLLLPFDIAACTIDYSLVAQARTRLEEGWRRLPGNDGVVDSAERAFAAAVVSPDLCRAAGQALRQGAEQQAMAWGHRVVAEGATAPAGTPVLHLMPGEVIAIFRPDFAPVLVDLAFGASLARPGGERRFQIDRYGPRNRTPLIADREPLLLRDLAADGAALARTRLAVLAREAGATAAAALVPALDDLRREVPPYDPPVCGLGPVAAGDGAALEAGEYPWGRDLASGDARPVPVPLDARDPVLAWEEWLPAGEIIPRGATLWYELRLWRSPRGGPDTPPLVELARLTAPRASLAGLIEPDQTYDWSARAVVDVAGGGRFATRWSYLYPRRWDGARTLEQAGACSLDASDETPLQLRAYSARGPRPRRVEDRPRVAP